MWNTDFLQVNILCNICQYFFCKHIVFKMYSLFIFFCKKFPVEYIFFHKSRRFRYNSKFWTAWSCMNLPIFYFNWTFFLCIQLKTKTKQNFRGFKKNHKFSKLYENWILLKFEIFNLNKPSLGSSNTKFGRPVHQCWHFMGANKKTIKQTSSIYKY